MHDKASNTDEYVHEEAVPLQFAQITHEDDIIFFTCLNGIKMFRMLFDYVKKKVSSMYYWDGSKIFFEAKKGNSSVIKLNLYYCHETLHRPRTNSPCEPWSKTKAHFGAGNVDVFNDIKAWFDGGRFSLSIRSVTWKGFSDIITWVKLMLKEFRVLVILPSSKQEKLTLPTFFRKLFPNTCVTIDYRELFIETPSSVEVEACFYTYSDYKHHCRNFFVQLNM